MTLTEVIIKSGLEANRVYYLLAQLKIKPTKVSGYPADTITRITEDVKNEHECYYRKNGW